MRGVEVGDRLGAGSGGGVRRWGEGSGPSYMQGTFTYVLWTPHTNLMWLLLLPAFHR